MERSFGVDDVAGTPPTWSVLVRRGLRRRCPRCAGRGVFRSRFRLRDRCPTCGYLFVREPGFFLGSWFVNFMVVEVLHFTLVMGFILWKSRRPEAGLLVPGTIAVVTGVSLPLFFYPYAQTIWAGIDLAMTPLELREIVDAADAVDQHSSSSSPEDDPG